MNVALIGSGSWGTAVAGLAAARAERVTMWAHSEQTAAGINGEHRNPRYLVDYVLPENVVATTDLAQALDGAEAIIFAVPSTHLRDVCHQAAPFIADETPVLCLTKGIEPESGLQRVACGGALGPQPCRGDLPRRAFGRRHRQRRYAGGGDL